METTTVNDGIVKWFNPAKGFGFISMEGGAEVFVHHTEIVMEGFKNLLEGEKVTFDVYENAKGQRSAKNVKRRG